MASNPGEYEFKVLWENKLARSIKFTVGPDGKLDNGIASANKVGTERVIVPVQIVGVQDGQCILAVHQQCRRGHGGQTHSMATR